MGTITCIGRDGKERDYSYTRTKDQFDETWHYRIKSIPPPTSGASFEINVVELSETKYRVTGMFHYNVPEYVARGIPDAMLPVIRQELGKSVVSSPPYDQGGVYRTCHATKVWKRLVSNNIATHIELDDIYEIP